MSRFVYDFDEPSGGSRELLGGKGIGLAEMTLMGLPVPAGFTITTDACRAYLEAGDLPAGLEQEVADHVRRLEETTGKRFGDPGEPLLVSVRSGAAVSMPGMMDTILNLGLNDEAVEALAARTGNRRFAFDSYRRLLQMFGEVVDGVDPHRFEEALGELKQARGARQDTDLSAEDLEELVETFKEIYPGFPRNATDQLLRAVRAVFDSWNTPRAQVYRRANDIPDDIGTAVNVVQMVFGNKGDHSGTGVAFTRNPSTGANELYGEFLANAQGEDVVAGIRTPQPVESMAAALPAAYEQLLDTLRKLEERYRDMQDVEFTVEDDTLYMLQTRSAKRTAAAALKAAVDMVEEGLISREEAVTRIDPAQLDQLLHPMIDLREAPEPVGRGLNASPGAASGAGDPRSVRDDAGRHPRDDRRAGRSHRARRHDLARCGRRARDGQAVRRGLRGARAPRWDCNSRRTRAARRRCDHDRRRHRQRLHRGDAARSAAVERGLRDGARLGRRDAPAACARERGHARGRGACARIRRRGDRPLPH